MRHRGRKLGLQCRRRAHAFVGSSTCSAVAPASPPKRIRELLRTATFFLFASLFTVLPTAVSVLAKSQFCADTSAGGLLFEDPETSCLDPSFKNGRKVEAKSMAVFYMMLPLIAFSVFFVESRAVSPTFSDQWLSFMTAGYRDRDKRSKEALYFAKGWEALSMFRKLLLTGVSLGLVDFSMQVGTFLSLRIFFRDARSQVCVSLLILACTLALHLRVRPWESSELNRLDTLSYIACISAGISVSSRVQTFLSPGYGSPPVEQLIFDLVAIAGCGPFIASLVFYLLDTASGGLMAPGVPICSQVVRGTRVGPR
jgi:hypothetical protein